MLIELARKKADQLDTMFVLSAQYQSSCGKDFVRTQFDIYGNTD